MHLDATGRWSRESVNTGLKSPLFSSPVANGWNKHIGEFLEVGLAPEFKGSLDNPWIFVLGEENGSYGTECDGRWVGIVTDLPFIDDESVSSC